MPLALNFVAIVSQCLDSHYTAPDNMHVQGKADGGKADLVADCCILGQDGDAPFPLNVVAVHDTLLRMLICSEHFALLKH